MIEFLLAAALVLRDPPGDAVGAGAVVPPSAEQYRDVGSFDLIELQVLDTPMLAFTIEMGALPNPGGLANGFSNPIIDVYVDSEEGGAAELLPGPAMQMPAGRGWEVAVRVTGDGAIAYRAGGDAAGATVSYPVQVSSADRIIRVETPFDRGEIDGVYAVTGVYDPFLASGWRAIESAPSPWAFASEDQQRPVVDVIAADTVAQAEAIRSGVLPVQRNRTAGAMWMLLMALGVLVAGVGLVLRNMVPPRAPAGARDGSGETVRGRKTTTGLRVEPERGGTNAMEDAATEPTSDAEGATVNVVLPTDTSAPATPPVREVAKARLAAVVAGRSLAGDAGAGSDGASAAEDSADAATMDAVADGRATTGASPAFLPALPAPRPAETPRRWGDDPGGSGRGSSTDGSDGGAAREPDGKDRDEAPDGFLADDDIWSLDQPGSSDAEWTGRDGFDTFGRKGAGDGERAGGDAAVRDETPPAAARPASESGSTPATDPAPPARDSDDPAAVDASEPAPEPNATGDDEDAPSSTTEGRRSST